MTTEDFNFLLTAHQKNTLKTPNSFLKVAGLVAGLVADQPRRRDTKRRKQRQISK